MKLTTTEFETLRTERERDVAWAAFDIRRTNSVLRLVRNGADERIVESRSDEEIPQIELELDPWTLPSKRRRHEPMFAKSPIASLAVAITLVIAAAALVIIVPLPFGG